MICKWIAKIGYLRLRSVRVLLLCLLLPLCGILTNCSQPVFESEQCISSRDSVKKFYSYHIANDMNPSEGYLQKREKYLSKELLDKVPIETDSQQDYFTKTDDYPKTFRAGSCEDAGKDKTKLEVLLFWRKNETNIQEEIEVEVVKEDNLWLINAVTAKK